MNESTEYLKTREWIIIIFYCGTMLFITLLTQILVPSEKPNSHHIHYPQPSTIEVSISGAVETPGIYKVEKGAQVQDLIALAKPLSNANLSKLKMTTVLAPGRHIKIPQIETVTVRIEGAVESPTTIKIVKGTKLKELIDEVTLLENADKRALLKQRPARDGETIIIPEKKGKSKRKVL